MRKIFCAIVIIVVLSGCSGLQIQSPITGNPAAVTKTDVLNYVTPWLNAADASVQTLCQGKVVGSQECAYATLAALVARTAMAAYQATPSAQNLQVLQGSMVPVYDATKAIAPAAPAPVNPVQ